MDRSQINLIDTRKRKTSSVDSGSYDHYSGAAAYPTPPRKMHRPNTDLGAMLRPTQIPHDKFRAIQDVLFDQQKLMDERGDEIKRRCDQIHRLHEDHSELRGKGPKQHELREKLDRKDAQLFNLQAQLKKAQADFQAIDRSYKDVKDHKQYADNFANDQNEMIELGRTLFAKESQKVQQLTEQARMLEVENRQLRSTVSERDTTISALTHQILQISVASPDQRVAIAVEAQAQTTLSYTRGLQRDVAERDKTIENLKAEKGVLVTANREWKVEYDRMNEANKTALRTAQEHAMEMESVTKAQAKLIDKIMNENKRLAANQQA